MPVSINFQSLPTKQQQLINAARELFCKHGTHRVTIKEICKSADVSKMTYYKYFNNKWDICKAVLDVLFYEAHNLFNEIVEEDIPLSKKVEKMLKFISARFNAVETAFINEDLFNEDSPVHQYFLELHKKSKELVIVFFKNAQSKGLIHSDIQMPFLFFMLDHLPDLVNHPDFIKIMPNIEDRIYQLSALFFHGFTRTPAKAE